MKVGVFSTKPYDRQFLDAANRGCDHELCYFDVRLTPQTAALAAGCQAVCAFVNDQLSRNVIERLAEGGTTMVALRSAGFNNVDLQAARDFGMTVGRVPAYSPNAVAEHSFALLLTLVRKTHRAYNRVREGNFSLDGLLGFDLAGKTIGIVGVGAIGSAVVRIGAGFGCRLLGFDPIRSPEVEALGLTYCTFDRLLSESDVVTLHCPLTEETRHLVDKAALERMKPGAILVNTSRGAVVDTHALIAALKSQSLGGLAIDVYEEEEGMFFEDLSEKPILDDQFVRLMTFPNVVITGHQGFFTAEALTSIAETTMANLEAFERSGQPVHPVVPERGAQFTLA